MKLNHINLTVTDVEVASNFLVKYFGMRSMGGNKGMGFLTDEQDGKNYWKRMCWYVSGRMTSPMVTIHSGGTTCWKWHSLPRTCYG
jgi:hypothetical protein